MDQLLSSFGKQGSNLGLLNRKVDIEDIDYSSKYFVLAEFTPVLTAGRNPIAFNGSSLLKSGSEILVECLDSQGNSLYIEQAKAVEYKFSDLSKFVISIHVYSETYNGPGKLVFIGTTQRGESVRWIGNITIDKTLTNASKVRFYSGPTLEVRPLLYPVVDTDLASDEVPPPKYTTPRATATIRNQLASITVTNGGSGYVYPPTVNISGGKGATAIANISDGLVVSITITDGGLGYKSPPSITFLGGDGSGATATSTISGVVSSIKVTDGGDGYDDGPPVVAINGGGGGGAKATAVVTDGVVTSIVVTAGGYGYLDEPTITFTAPVRPEPPKLNVEITFTAEFYAYAVTPEKNTNRNSIDRKKTNVDYRLVATDISDANLLPIMIPVEAFNSQMEGKTITLTITRIQTPRSNKEENVNITSEFKIKKVIDSKTIILSDPFYYQIDQDQLITNIISGVCTVTYDFIKYNTNPESNLVYTPADNVTEIEVKQSYAEITYRNLKTFSGFVARHKLYRRSFVYPGDYQLISDEPLGAIELLSDAITFNKAYNQIGSFYNQFHVDKYWFSSDPTLTLTAKSSPINSVYINGGVPNTIDGSRRIIVKTDSIGIENDNIYYPYNESEFNNLSGTSYNSNFISLKKNALYALSLNVIMEKDKLDTTPNVSFYFTSSITSIQNEKAYDKNYGLKLGDISTEDITSIKYFSDTQTLFFTVNDDYFGTLVIVPYHCNLTLSNVSLKVYGDYGFSPEILFINIPFPVNVKEESFDIKSELFDINSTLIFSDLRTTQTFDADGDSLNSTIQEASKLAGTIGVVHNDTTNNMMVVMAADSTTRGNVYVPNLAACDETPHRLVGWHVPAGDPNTAGQLCYTPISNIIIDSNDYISLTTVDANGIETTARSMAIQYDGLLNKGRKICILADGTKIRTPPGSGI